MTRKAEWIRYPVLTDILRLQESLCVKMEHCGHKYEPTNHMHTAVNSYAPVRCLRMGAFCIVLRENFPPVMVADLAFYVFLRRKGERHYPGPMGKEGRREK